VNLWVVFRVFPERANDRYPSFILTFGSRQHHFALFIFQILPLQAGTGKLVRLSRLIFSKSAKEIFQKLSNDIFEICGDDLFEPAKHCFASVTRSPHVDHLQSAEKHLCIHVD